MEFTQNSILRINNYKLKELIDLYKREECLWNSERPEYTDTKKRKEAAERIAADLNVPYFEAKHVVLKLKNLRNTYCQELKKIAQSISAGAGTVYKPKVFWFPFIDFVRPHLQPIRSSKSCLTNLMNTASENRVPIVQLEDHSFEQTKKVQNAGENLVVLEDFSEDEDCKWEIEDSIQSKRQKLSMDETPAEELSEGSTDQIVRTLHEIVSHLHTLKISENQRDHYDIFGSYVASLLRKLPEERALRLQPEIINLIVSADLDNTELDDDNAITPDV